MSNVIPFPAERLIKVAEELNFKRLNEDEALRAAAGIRDTLEYCQHIPNYADETISPLGVKLGEIFADFFQRVAEAIEEEK